MSVNKENNSNIDQRLKSVKNAVDNLLYDYKFPLKTVQESASNLLDTEFNEINKIYQEINEANHMISQLSTMVKDTEKFCEDLDVEIKAAYQLSGIELNWEIFTEDDEEQQEEELSVVEEEITENLENMDISDKPVVLKDSAEGFHTTFYEPTPAKPKSQSKTIKKLF